MAGAHFFGYSVFLFFIRVFSSRVTNIRGKGRGLQKWGPRKKERLGFGHVSVGFKDIWRYAANGMVLEVIRCTVRLALKGWEFGGIKSTWVVSGLPI